MYWFFTHLVAFLAHKTVPMTWRQIMPRPGRRSFPPLKTDELQHLPVFPINLREEDTRIVLIDFSLFVLQSNDDDVEAGRKVELFILNHSRSGSPPRLGCSNNCPTRCRCQIKEADKVLWFWNWIRTLGLYNSFNIVNCEVLRQKSFCEHPTVKGFLTLLPFVHRFLWTKTTVHWWSIRSLFNIGMRVNRSRVWGFALSRGWVFFCFCYFFDLCVENCPWNWGID